MSVPAVCVETYCCVLAKTSNFGFLSNLRYSNIGILDSTDFTGGDLSSIGVNALKALTLLDAVATSSSIVVFMLKLGMVGYGVVDLLHTTFMN